MIVKTIKTESGAVVNIDDSYIRKTLEEQEEIRECARKVYQNYMINRKEKRKKLCV